MIRPSHHLRVAKDSAAPVTTREVTTFTVGRAGAMQPTHVELRAWVVRMKNVQVESIAMLTFRV